MTHAEKRWLWILKFIYKGDIPKLIEEARQGRKEADKRNHRQLSSRLSEDIFILEGIYDKLQAGDISMKDIHISETEEDEYGYINQDQHFRDMGK